MLTLTPLASSSQANAYHIGGDYPLLLECGMRFAELRKALNFRLSSLGACLLSHEHGDHSKAAKEVLKAGVDCYMSEGTAKALNLKGHRLHIIKALKQFKAGSWTILPFDIRHDAEEPLGFLLSNRREKILFATDTSYIKYKFSGLTHILVECNYQEEILNKNVDEGVVPIAMKNRLIWSHFSLRNVLKMLKANDLSKVECIYLLHLSDGNSNEQEMKQAVQKLTGKPVMVCPKNQ